ncbi:MAG: hypothetical protein R3C24_04560 [Cyanobacteriota/Melainabacteria group bacterium]
MTSARPSSAQVRQVYEQMRIARQDVARCDLELSHQMKTVLAKMRLYFKERKKIDLLDPLVLEREEQALKIARSLKENPYKILTKQSTAEQSSESESSETRVKFVLAPSLSESNLTDWRKEPPTQWKETPGTISIVHNGYDFFIVWGASFDGKPVCFDGKTKILSMRLKY